MPEPLSTGAKTGIVFLGLALIGGLVYWVTRPVASASNMVAAADPYLGPVKGALGPNDEAVVLSMVNVIKTSPKASDITYMASILPEYMAGGGVNYDNLYKGQWAVMLNGQRVVPKSASMMSAYWTGLLGSYVSDYTKTPPTPAAGKTQEDADIAMATANQLMHLYQAYQAKISSPTVKNSDL